MCELRCQLSCLAGPDETEVGTAGFEPAASRSQSERAARLRHIPAKSFSQVEHRHQVQLDLVIWVARFERANLSAPNRALYQTELHPGEGGGRG